MMQQMYVKEPPFFTEFCTNGWVPEFCWFDNVHMAADTINRPHEDYPARVDDTAKAIIYTWQWFQYNYVKPYPTSEMVRIAHSMMFPDHGDGAGQWRTVNVRVGSHIAPQWEIVPKLMAELDFWYADLPEMTVERLKHWYFDFETIHPFVDGNGRAGGVMIAAISKYLTGGSMLTPGQ